MERLPSVSEILSFYKRFEEVRAMGSIAHIDTSRPKDRAMRQVKAGEVRLDEKGFHIDLSPATLSYVAHEMDPKGYFFLGLEFFKYHQKERDVFIYFPLVMVKVERDKLLSGKMSDGKILHLDWNTKLHYEKSVLDFFFPGLKTADGDVDFLDYMPDRLDEFVPVRFRTMEDAVGLLGYWKEYFLARIGEEFKDTVIFPFLEKENSAAMMFFHQKEKAEFSLEREFDDAMDETSPLLEEYLTFFQKENDPLKPESQIWLGALTKTYPLGKGQAAVLRANSDEKEIVPVIGGPGTGKSTLFLSVIANEVTKRAVNLVKGGEDYSNFMLLTSTSNKAIENVVKGLQHKSFHGGFCYVGGSSANKEKSLDKVAQFKEYFISQKYSKELQEKYKKGIENILGYFEKVERGFQVLKDEHIEIIKKYKLYSKPLIQSFVDSIEIDFDLARRGARMMGDISRAEKIMGISLKEVTDSLWLKMESVKEDLTNAGFMKRVFSSKTIYEPLPFECSSKEEFEFVYETVKFFREQKEEAEKAVKELLKLEEKEHLEALLKTIEEYKIPDSLLKRIERTKNFSEFFRTNLYSLNYKLNRLAIKYLFQEALKRKSRVLDAINYFFDPNPFTYLRDVYGFSERDLEIFFKDLSLVYPVMTSALASAHYQFPRFVKKPWNMVLADESGMITVQSVIPVLNRAKRALIVGDPKQLPPVVDIADPFVDNIRKECTREFWEAYSPVATSAFHRAAGAPVGDYIHTGRAIVLDEHRRCAPQIAELFIKLARYEGVQVKSSKPNGKAFQNIKNSLIFYNIEGKREPFKRVNKAEAKAVSVLVERFLKNGYSPKDIGVITPFRDQESFLQKLLPHIKMGTVHKFQGSEMKVVIFSTVVTGKDDLSFVNNVNMVNVAVSRAKEVFCVVGNFKKLTSANGPAKEMASFIREKGMTINM